MVKRTTHPNPMRIVQLDSENVKRLRAAHIKPDGNMVVIGGKNGAGKTSVLDSIMYALGGRDAIPVEPIRRGAEEAAIDVDLGDLKVRRTFTAKGSYLTVTTTDGAKYPSPQAMLDDLVGRLSFDPVAFSRMKPAEQAAALRELVGIDHSELDAKRKAVYDRRTEANRDLKRLNAQVDGMTHHEDAPDEPVSVTELSAKLEEAIQCNRKIELAAEDAMKLARDVEMIDEMIASLEEKLNDARADRAKVAERLARCEAAALEAKPIDTREIREQIAAAESINAKVRDNQRRAAAIAERDEFAGSVEQMTARIAEFDAKKEADLAAAAFPVEGLGFDENGVTLNGVPFAQASAAEQLRVSVAMGLAANPRLRVILIRDASLLDVDSMALLEQMADEHDAQLWVERVGEGDECSIVIEDGAVKGAKPEPVEA